MSDQDFFFDEDEKPAAKAQAKKAGSAPVKTAAKATAPPADFVAPPASSVTMTIAVLVGVIGILVGAIIGIFIGRSLGTTNIGTAPGVIAPASTNASAAPQLSPDQLNSGELPAGHPSIGDQSSATTSGK